MADISDNIQHAAMSALIMGVMTDMEALRAAVLLITAKLDADVGVTDVNYASLCNPAALTTVA